jgi:hypothetical protein
MRTISVVLQYCGEKPRVFCDCLICGKNLLTLNMC